MSWVISGSQGAVAFAIATARPLTGRVYVYTEPRLEAANAAVLAALPTSFSPNDEHLAEVRLHEALLRSAYRTRDASAAALFFLPFYGKIATKPHTHRT